MAPPCLADGLDNGSSGRHGETAAHVVLVFQYAFLEELVGTGGSLAGVDYDFAVVSAHLLPVGDFAPEDIFSVGGSVVSPG